MSQHPEPAGPAPIIESRFEITAYGDDAILLFVSFAVLVGISLLVVVFGRQSGESLAAQRRRRRRNRQSA